MKRIILYLLCCPTLSFGQTTQNTPTIKESIEQFKNIFKKKEASPAAQQATSSGYQQLTGGRISPQAVYLEVDRMNDFNQGSAIVYKGSSSAMIDATGKTIIPFNTYTFAAWNTNGSADNTFAYHQHQVAGTGIFQADTYRFINAQGRELKNPSSQNVNFKFTPEKSLLESKSTFTDQVDRAGNRYNTYYYITASGKTYTLPYQLSNIQEDIGIMTINGKKGYAHLNGEKLTEAVFDEARPFSNGMAVVGQRDAFGLLKYGFINRVGEISIPISYSKEPSHFSCGFAIIYPKDYPSQDEQLAYAFINKEGVIVRSFTVAEQRKHSFYPFQDYGLAYGTNGYVMDTTFHIQSRQAFFARYGIPGNPGFSPSSFDHGTNRLPYRENLFSIRGETNPKIYYATKEGIGFINLTSQTVVLPTFARLGYFDPISHLAYAEIGRNQQIIKGYINEAGEWVILQRKGQTW